MLFVELVPVREHFTTEWTTEIESETFIIFVDFLVKHNHGETIVGRIYHEIFIREQSIGHDTVTANYTGFSQLYLANSFFLHVEQPVVLEEGEDGGVLHL